MSNLLSISTVFTYVGYIIIAIIVLLLMVLIHELGHYTAGKILKFKINEFSVGFGPKILQKKKKDGELISLRAFPLGGYCAFEGENEDGSESKDAFNNQKPWKRLIVLFCGAFFNFLSAIIFSFILLVSNGYDLVSVNSVNSSSINYGYLETGDVILGIDGDKIDFLSDKYISNLITLEIEGNYPKLNDNDIISYEFTSDDGKVYRMVKREINYDIRRDGKEIVQAGYINVIYDEKGTYAGWSLLSTESDNGEFGIGTYKYTFFEALKESVPFTCKWAVKVLKIFGQLITGKLSITALGGPVTTINMIASYTQQSLNYLLLLLPLIAVNLAVFNLLPIPALDGCQMLFVLIEWIRKKPINRKVINAVNTVGLFALLGFVLIVDLIQFII